jgi:hypothetical protein
MSPEEKLEMGRKMIAEAEAEIAAKKRNWPEKIEAGMVFQSPATTATWMATDVDGLFVCLKGEADSFKAAGRTMRLNRESVPHAGRARDILTIRTDAHEPTGAELVGKMCQVSLYHINKADDGIMRRVTSFDPATGYRTKEGEILPWKYARLAR